MCKQEEITSGEVKSKATKQRELPVHQAIQEGTDGIKNKYVTKDAEGNEGVRGADVCGFFMEHQRIQKEEDDEKNIGDEIKRVTYSFREEETISTFLRNTKHEELKDGVMVKSKTKITDAYWIGTYLLIFKQVQHQIRAHMNEIKDFSAAKDFVKLLENEKKMYQELTEVGDKE